MKLYNVVSVVGVVNLFFQSLVSAFILGPIKKARTSVDRIACKSEFVYSFLMFGVMAKANRGHSFVHTGIVIRLIK